MSQISIFVLILFAAFLHASWNIIIKSVSNSLVAMGIMTVTQSIIFAPLIFFFPIPSGITWFFIFGSVVLHNIYFINLGQSYNKGDLSFIYPVARGCAPVFVTILSIIFLKENISTVGIFGILIVSCGLLFLAIEHYKNNFNFDILRISIFIALIISLYTFCDGAGVRSVENSFSYIVWLFFLEGWVTIGYVYLHKKDELLTIQPRELILIICGSIMSFIAYSITIWSMKYIAIGYVASIRESSIIFVAIIGVLFLKEKITWVRLFSACIFFVGVVLIYNS